MGNVGYENGSVHSLTIPYPLSPIAFYPTLHRFRSVVRR